jgi:acyl-CoA thioester hydrolase
MRNEFLRPDGKLAARVTSEGGWIDLQARKVAEPPEELLRALRKIPRTDDFQVLPSRLR